MSRQSRFAASSTLIAALVIAAIASLVALAGCDHHSVASPTAAVPTAKEPAAEPVSDSTSAGPARQSLDQSDTSETDQASTATETAATETATTAAQTPSRPPPKDPASTRAPADRGPTRPGDAEKITFDDLNLGMQQDMVFRPFLVTERVQELDGKKVRITGFIHAGAAGLKGIREFVLLKNTECKFGAGGQADHLAMVYLTPGETTKYQLAAIKVEGTLKVKPYEGTDGNTWSVYDLADAKVVQ